MAKFGIGQPVRRVEDQRFLTGQGRYVDDIVLPAMAHGVNVVSPHAHDYSQWIGNDLFYQPVDASQRSHRDTRRGASTHKHA